MGFWVSSPLPLCWGVEGALVFGHPLLQHQQEFILCPSLLKEAGKGKGWFSLHILPTYRGMEPGPRLARGAQALQSTGLVGIAS